MKNIFLISFLSILAVDAFGQSASDLVNNPGSNPPSTNGQAPNNPPVTTYPPVTTPNSEVETQANGQYPAIQRETSTVPLGQIQPVWTKAKPTAGIYVANYNPGQHIKVVTRLYMTTTISFPEWETIDRAELGDTYAFAMEKPKQNILLIRATREGGDTSLTAIGNSGRIYIFYLRSEGVKSPNIPDLHVEVNVLGGTPSKATASLASVDPATFHFDYTMSGNPAIAPQRVFSAGGFTYFDYGEKNWHNMDLPAVYRVVDGIETPVNTRVENFMIVAEITGDFTLRSGQKYVCVKWKSNPQSSKTASSQNNTQIYPKNGK